jgi:pyroglutamyl-peptidase
MGPRRLLITGFGPFPGIERNPSREIAQALERSGLGENLHVDAAELPVVFADVAPALDVVLARLEHRPDVLLGLGVWSKGQGFRLERCARGTFDASRLDNAGETGAGIDLGPELRTDFDLPKLAGVMEQAGATSVLLSDDAGRYVCERTYRQLLTRGEELGARALFLHVPRLEAVALERQIAVVRALAVEILA